MKKKINLLSLAILSALTAGCAAGGGSVSSTSSSSSSSSSSTTSSSSSSTSGAATYLNVKGGFITPTAQGANLYPGFNGHSNLVISQNTSELAVHVWGLTPDASYKTILNQGTCASTSLMVYQHNNEGNSSVAPEINVNSYGMGMGHVIAPFAVRETALSVAIKELGGELVIGCVDLHSSQGFKGAIVNGGAKSFYREGAGYVSANDNGRSIIEINTNGWPTEGTLKATANKSTCEETPAHYLQDTTGADIASNGLWLQSTESRDNLSVTAWASNLFKVRLNEIKSIEYTDLGTAFDTGCTNLTTKILMFRSGNFKPTDNGVALYGTLSGRAILETSKEGVTMATIAMKGLKANATYSNHVHNDTCANAGGGHYLHEIGGADNAINGIFPVFTTDSSGQVRYTLSVNKIVRPDARSIVIHEPGSGAKIACADLN